MKLYHWSIEFHLHFGYNHIRITGRRDAFFNVIFVMDAIANVCPKLTSLISLC